MIKIGIKQSIIEEYYKNIENLKSVKYDIIKKDGRIIAEKEFEGGKIMNPLSKKEKEIIAELNTISGTKYPKTEIDLKNNKDLMQ